MLYRNYVRILYIDLTNKKIRFEEREDLLEYVGGSGVSAKLFSELVQFNNHPLDPNQPIVFAIGPFSTIFPVCTKVVCSFYSPQTNEYGESHAGGRLAMAIRFANLDAIVILGKAKIPTYITIKPNDVIFHDAEAIWNMPIGDSGQYMRYMAGAPGHRSIIRIGPAGTKLVNFACVNVDSYRHFGRLGLGAVFGSKNLKGLVICGDYDFKIKKVKEYNQFYTKIYDKVTKTNIMAKYHELGTSKNVLPLNKINALPTYNLKQSQFEYAENISGEAFANEVLHRKVSCVGCPIGCIHIGLLRKLFDAGYEYESFNVSYDHELIYSLGSLIGIKNTIEILDLINEAEELGMDAITLGVILAFLTNAYENGDITKEELLTDIKFGDTKAYINIIRNIVNQPNEFYGELSKGLYKFVTSNPKYKHLYDYALQLGGLEMAGYFTGPAHLAGGVIGIRHSHLDNAGYAIDQKVLSLNLAQDAQNFALNLVNEEILRSFYTSLVICLFAREVYDMNTICEAFDVLDIKISEDEIIKKAKKILKLKLDIRKKLGFDALNFKLAQRFFETKSPYGMLKKEFVDEIIKKCISLFEQLS